jgi:hypothetical protein
MARRTRPRSLALGFLGGKEVDERLMVRLLDDMIQAEDTASVKFLLPVTVQHYSDPLRRVVAYALAEDIPFEAVTDRASQAHKEIKEVLGKATKVHTVSRIPHKLVDFLATQANPKMLMLWENTEDAFTVLELVDQQQIDAFDLAQGLVPIEWGGEPEQLQGELMTEEDLDETEGEEDESEEYEDEGEDEGEDEPEDEEDEGEPELEADAEDDSLYSREDLEALDLDALKEICSVNDIEVPGQRPRAHSYVTAILEFQGNLEEQESETEAEETELTDEPEQEPEYAGADFEAMLKEHSEGIHERLAGLEAKLTGIKNSLTKLHESVKAAPAPRATAPAKKVAKATAPAKKASAKPAGAGGRGRPPLPRDRWGNIIRKDAAPAKKTAKKVAKATKRPAAASGEKRGRGRPPMPRDRHGNIIRK